MRLCSVWVKYIDLVNRAPVSINQAVIPDQLPDAHTKKEKKRKKAQLQAALAAEARYSQHLTALTTPFFKMAQHVFEVCFGPGTLTKTRVESRIKKLTPHCVCSTGVARYDTAVGTLAFRVSAACWWGRCGGVVVWWCVGGNALWWCGGVVVLGWQCCCGVAVWRCGGLVVPW